VVSVYVAGPRAGICRAVSRCLRDRARGECDPSNTPAVQGARESELVRSVDDLSLSLGIRLRLTVSLQFDMVNV